MKKDYVKIIGELKEKLTDINFKVFKLRVKRRRTGVTLEENYTLRKLILNQKRLKKQINNLTANL